MERLKANKVIDLFSEEKGMTLKIHIVGENLFFCEGNDTEIIPLLQSRIKNLEREVDESRGKILALQGEISRKEAQISITEEQIEESKGIYGALVAREEKR